MKTVTLISSIITTLLIMSTMICGMWLKAKNISDPSSLAFHMNFGIASVVFCFITMILLIIFLLGIKKKGEE
ncbi:hypothetical protein [Candidatus Galacturonibacter soehngenii]|uniref:Uncharacterized protein n=1 Tax=Candidatus Galacturonatibacter soehngenii TaxID=2307010 RepID=A0A7V7QHS7_9FIRM|nr:hypothetical protein [Candidatus Galacturonibacter soehngenii]KAB1434536.1 hypothetical protein F7O84_18810 [Candidatus Galacturonibacter soehngenii]MBA4688158.1 hypothetical protein [Candidatus Galacturonibacter soehngenii]